MEIRWISEVGVRWGSDEGSWGVEGGFGGLVGVCEGDGDGEAGGGVFGGVVEMERVESGGVMVGERRWMGMLLGLDVAVKMSDLLRTGSVERRGCGW